MEPLKKYKQLEQMNILATLKVVQDKGWSPYDKDPYQFHIILGDKIIAFEENIKSVENDLASCNEENLQKEKSIKDLKYELKNERENNESIINNQI